MRPYEQKIDLVDLLARDDVRLAHGLTGALKELGRGRNIVAHGSIIRDLESGGLLIKRGERPVDKLRLEELSREAQALHDGLVGIWIDLTYARRAEEESRLAPLIAPSSDCPPT